MIKRNHRNTSTASASRKILSLFLAALMVVGPLPAAVFVRHAIAAPAATPADAPPKWDTPLTDPVLEVPAKFTANKTASWAEGDARLMLLEGDASFTMGTYGFRGDRVVVRIDKEQQPGRLVRHFSIYLDNARPLSGVGPVTAEAPRLFVTASTVGDVDLATDLLLPESKASDVLVVEAQQRFVDYRAKIEVATMTTPPATGAVAMTPEVAALREERQREIGEGSTARSEESLVAEETKAKAQLLASKSEAAAANPATPATHPGKSSAIPESARILPSHGIVAFGADRVAAQPSENGENTVVLMGHVRVLFESFEGKPGASLTAENAVIFIAGEKMTNLSSGRFQASDVHGIYLEDNAVVTYDQYTVRAPRVFYELATNKAIVLDAVMYTWDVKVKVPIYVRAEKLRQETANVWVANNAAVTTSEFAVPHFSIAASRMVIHQETPPGGTAVTRFDATDATARIGTTPFFYWPELSGDVSKDIPLRRVSATYSNRNGAIIKTTWDVFTLAGVEKPPGVQLDGEFDYDGYHGAAIGESLQYDEPMMFGSIDTYLVAHDTGTDRLGDRNDVGFDGQTRGYALLRHRQYLPDNWEVSIEAAYVSDPTFLEEFFRRQAAESKPYETSAYIKKQEDDWAFTFLTKFNANNFVPQTTTLQTPGYAVDKLPELGYYRVATPLWDGRLTYYTENLASRLRIRPGSDTPRDRGFTEAQSLLLFGINNTQPYTDEFTDEQTDDHLRIDTRHEVDAPMKIAIFDVTPYVAGRFTGYDDDFHEFSKEDDQFRFWGSTGVRLDTQFSKTYDDAESDLFNIHRIRHIIEPNADLFVTASSVDKTDLPQFDPDVEGIQDGPGVKLGLRNIFQTQRGGDGQWRDVDWLIIDTDLVLHDRRNDEPNEEGAIAQFIDYRPEYSLGGNHFHGDIMWQISDTLAVVGDMVHDFETGQTSEWRVGINMQHTPDLASFIDYTDLDPLSSRLINFGFTYNITRKYTVELRQTIDVGGQKNRSIDITITRKLPRWQLVVLAKIDEIDNEQTFSIVLVPEGINTAKLADPLGIMRARD